MMPGSKCSLCKKNEPSCFFQYCTDSGEKRVFAICDECAEARGIDLGSPDAVASLFETEGDSESAVQMIDMGEVNPECPTCGKSLQDIVDSGTVGCETCYKEYGAVLRRIRELLNRDEPEPMLPEGRDLNAELAQALEDEDYEKAAEIRDLIEEGEGD